MKHTGQADADVFTAIAHPVRRQILDRLARGEIRVNDIAAPFDISRSAVSQHLKILLDSELVVRERHGREQVYRLRPDNLNQVAEWLKKYEAFWTEKLVALGEFLDSPDADDDSTPS